MATIITTLTHRFNRSLDIGGITVTFNDKGEADVPDSKVAALLVEPGISVKGASVIEPIAVGEDVVDTDEVELDNTVEGEIDYSEFSKSDLQEIAAGAGLPKEDWSKLNKAQLIAYLKNNMTE